MTHACTVKIDMVVPNCPQECRAQVVRACTLVEAVLLLSTDMVQTRQAKGKGLARSCGSNANHVFACQGIWPRDRLDGRWLLEVPGRMQQFLRETCTVTGALEIDQRTN